MRENMPLMGRFANGFCAKNGLMFMVFALILSIQVVSEASIRVSPSQFIRDLNKSFPHATGNNSEPHILPLSQQVRISGAMQIRNRDGNLIHVRFAGSTHDWEGLIARKSEIDFLTTSLFSQSDAKDCDLYVEQSGDDYIPNEIARMIDSSKVLADLDQDLLSSLRNQQLEDLTEMGQLARAFVQKGRRVTNADLKGGLSAVDYAFKKYGAQRAYDLIYGGMNSFFFATTPRSFSISHLDPAIGRALGDELLSRTQSAEYFRENPFSKLSSYAIQGQPSTPAPTDDERDEYFAYKMLSSPKSICFLSHTGHILGAMKFLGERIDHVRVDAIEPNTDLAAQLRKDKRLCLKDWPSGYPSRFRCS